MDFSRDPDAGSGFTEKVHELERVRSRQITESKKHHMIKAPVEEIAADGVAKSDVVKRHSDKVRSVSGNMKKRIDKSDFEFGG